MITQARAREMFDYDPDTGVFVRRISVARRKKALAGQIAGSLSANGYLRVMIDGKSILLHRLAFIYMGCQPPKCVDHINGDRTDNRWANLRAADHVINGRNTKRPITNTSGFIGVSWDRFTGKWVSQMRIGDERLFFGRFEHIEDAIAARKQAEKKYGFHKNHGREGRAAAA